VAAPLTIRFRHRPLFGALICVVANSIFYPYPSVRCTLTLTFSLTPTFPDIFLGSDGGKSRVRRLRTRTRCASDEPGCVRPGGTRRILPQPDANVQRAAPTRMFAALPQNARLVSERSKPPGLTARWLVSAQISTRLLVGVGVLVGVVLGPIFWHLWIYTVSPAIGSTWSAMRS